MIRSTSETRLGEIKITAKAPLEHDPARRLLSKAIFGSLVVTSLAGVGAAAFAPKRRDFRGVPMAAVRQLVELERRIGARIGVKAINTGTGATIDHRESERFPMCSTHKVLVAAAILSQVERGVLALDRRVAFGPADLLDYAPVTKANVGRGFMTVEELCAAAVRLSDNTADNLLLELIDGPAGWTRYARGMGDHTSRLDRIEPDVNSAIPGDDRDTSTPAAMAASISGLLLGRVLQEDSRKRLTAWMLDAETTASLFRASIPADWHVADKSGSGSNGTRNDFGVLYPPSAPPIVLSVFTTGLDRNIEVRNRLVRDCASVALRSIAPGHRDVGPSISRSVPSR